MKLIHVLQMLLVQLVFFALKISASTDEDNGKKDRPHLALSPALIAVALLSLMFMTWNLWRTIRNRGPWKIHVQSPRSNHVRTWLGWVDRETWELKQSQRAKRKEAKRDQHKFFRTTKVNYKWIFFGPTRELQKRFDDQKKRPYLCLLPSWMRSYPHGTLQPGTLAGQVKAPKGIYQLQFPEHQSSTYSRLSKSKSLGNAQSDGYPTSGAPRDPYPLPDGPGMKRSDAIMPRSPGKSCLLPKVPISAGSRVIQVWHIRERPLPERLGRPQRESEQELSGVVEPQETLIRRDTEHRLVTGHPRERMNRLYTEAEVRMRFVPTPIPIFDQPTTQYPEVFTRRPMEHPTAPLPESFVARRQRYIDSLERRIQDVRTDPTLMLVHGTLDHLMREVYRVGGARHRQRPIMGNRQAPIASRPPVQDPPVPSAVSEANRLRQYIEDLERRIHDIRTEPTLAPMRGTLDLLMHELRSARATRERLGPIASLRPAVPTSQYQPRNIQANPLPTPIQDTAGGFEPRPTAQPEMWRFGTAPDPTEALDSMDRLQRLASENFRNHLRNLQNRSGVLDVQALNRAVDAFNNLFQGILMSRANVVSTASLRSTVQELRRHIRNTNVSYPTIVTPPTQPEAHRAEIVDPATDDYTSSNPNSEDENEDGDRAVTEGPETDVDSGLNLASEEGNRPPRQNSIAAVLLRSIPDRDPPLDQADPAAQRHLEPEEGIRAETTRQTAASHTEMGSSSPRPDRHVPAIPVENSTTPFTTLHSPPSSTAAGPSPPATVTQATATSSLISQELEDALNEELYTDAY